MAMGEWLYAYLVDETFLFFGLFSNLNGLFGQDLFGLNSLF